MLVLVLASQEAVAPPPRHLHRPDQDQHDLNNNIGRGNIIYKCYKQNVKQKYGRLTKIVFVEVASRLDSIWK